MRISFFILLFVSCATSALSEVPVILAHPIYAKPFSCTEHWDGELLSLGDALGNDCVVQKMAEIEGRSWLRSHSGSGLKNQDWYGWQEEVLSPAEGIITKLQDNSTTNQPGVVGKPPASFIVISREDGLNFLLAHVVGFRVKVGDTVKAGQILGVVGNNGFSRSPHVHIGAWKGATPMQIRFDQTAMAKFRKGR